MPEARLALGVRPVNGIASIIDIQGELTAFAEQVLMKSYLDACTPDTCVIILNFSDMIYMNSSGIGLIVTLLIRINRDKRQLFAYGLSEHYQNIFKLTRLNDSIQIYTDEIEAIKALRFVPSIVEKRSANAEKRSNFFKRR